MVAERPMIWILLSTWSFSLSRIRESCTPLLDSMSSWYSSTTMYRTFLRCGSKDLTFRTIPRVSGVVMRMSGGFLTCLLLSAWVVSPCLILTSIPRSSPISTILLNISLFKALRGVM
jgi:hypothetical protein